MHNNALLELEIVMERKEDLSISLRRLVHEHKQYAGLFGGKGTPGYLEDKIKRGSY